MIICVKEQIGKKLTQKEASQDETVFAPRDAML